MIRVLAFGQKQILCLISNTRVKYNLQRDFTRRYLLVSLGKKRKEIPIHKSQNFNTEQIRGKGFFYKRRTLKISVASSWYFLYYTNTFKDKHMFSTGIEYGIIGINRRFTIIGPRRLWRIILIIRDVFGLSKMVMFLVIKA